MKISLIILLLFPILSFSQTDSTVIIRVKIKKDAFQNIESFKVLDYNSPEIDSIVKKELENPHLPIYISHLKNIAIIYLQLTINKEYIIRGKVSRVPPNK